MFQETAETRSLSRIRAFVLGLATLAAVSFLSSSAHADLRSATLRQDAMVYRQPNDVAQVLGRLRQGKNVRVYFPDRNGWYAVAFSQPIQGAKYGWVHAEDLDVSGDSGGRAGGRGASRGNNKLKRSWVDIELDLRDMSPSTFQSAIGEPSSSFFAKGFGLEFGHRINNIFGLAFRGIYYSWSNTATAQTGGTYGASGYGMTAGADFLFVNKSGFQLSGGAGVGLSLNTAQNSSSTSGYQTTNIMAYPIYGKLAMREFFGNGAFGLLGELGYELHTLSAVPVQAVSGNQATANIDVGGLILSFGLGFQF